MADPPRRVNFFDGLLLSAADMAVEQEYGRRMRYLHNRLHGYGTVCGLEVEIVDGQVRSVPDWASTSRGARLSSHRL